MRRMMVIGLCGIMCYCGIYSGCSRTKEQPDTPLIAVSILPQAWFVSRIGGERVQTLVLAGPGQNPHNYEPSPRQVSELSRAGAWILSGTEFEISLRPKIQKLFPSLPVVDGTAGVSFRRLETHNHAEHDVSANADAETVVLSLTELDRHTWLGPEPAKILAAHILRTLSAIDPAGEEQYAGNYQTLIQDIDAVFAEMRRELAPLQGTTVFVYHPSFGYFLDEFGITQEAVETGGKTPGPRELARLIALAQVERPAAIFVQAQFPAAAAQTVAAAVGAELISLDPLAPDWLDTIRRMGEALQKVMKH